MRLVRFEMSNVRNIQRASGGFAPRFNEIHGANGAGKTAFLEGLHLGLTGRSFRSRRLAEVLRRGSDELLIRLTVDPGEGRPHRTLAISKRRTGSPLVVVDGDRVQQLSALASVVPVQTLLPDAAELIFGGPAERRASLDWALFHVEHGYAATLRAYLRTVRQRNAWLRTSGAPGSDPFADSLMSNGRSVDGYRRRYYVRFEAAFQRVVTELSPETGVTVAYAAGWPDGREFDAELLGEHRAREVKLGATQVGPHRADLRFTAGGVAAASILSRGQGKVIATAVKLAHAAVLFESKQIPTLFLIDDVGAELDAVHNRRLFDQLEVMGSQVVATSIARSGFGELYSELYPERSTGMFHVEHGEVRTEGVPPN